MYIPQLSQSFISIDYTLKFNSNSSWSMLLILTKHAHDLAAAAVPAAYDAVPLPISAVVVVLVPGFVLAVAIPAAAVFRVAAAIPAAAAAAAAAAAVSSLLFS